MCVPSIRVRTTCVSRAWHGGCEQTQITCNTTEINQIFTALCSIMNKVENCSLSGLGNLKECLLNSFNTVVWKCASLGSNVLAQSSGNEITLSPNAFGSSSARFEAIVFHELIHHCGGTELDAEAFENHCYAGNGATFPTSGDWPKFRDNGGNFVNWNPTTGALTTTGGDTLSPSFPDPNPPSGGGGGDGWI